MGKLRSAVVILLFVCGLATVGYGEQRKTRIFVVSSYDREYLWSQSTNKGVCSALLDFKFIDNQKQADQYSQNDFLETDKLVIKKAWMDTRRKSTKKEIAVSCARIIDEINAFKPDAILLGDDNATNYIGNPFMDTDIPVVFWGVDGTPLKFGLVDSIEHPGHNITGVYQPGYAKDCLEYLKMLVPEAKTFVILSDSSETGRAKAKIIQELARAGKLPMTLTDTILTNSFVEWKAAASGLQDSVDAFFLLNHNTLVDDGGNKIEQLKAGAWYLAHIKKPECAPEEQFVLEGALIAVDDSGFKQGYEAVRFVNLILRENKNPAELAVITPSRGAIIVNRARAKMLGIEVSGKTFIEEFVDTSVALDKYPQ